MSDINTTIEGPLVRSLLGAARDAIEFAVAALRSIPDAIDAGNWDGTSRSGEDATALLDRLLGEPSDLDTHLGDPATELDRVAHQRISAHIHADFPRALIAGEEADEISNEDAEKAPPGTLVVLADAIDGSEHADCFGFGYSSNLIAFEILADATAHPLVSLVVNSSRQVLGYSRADGPFYGTVDELRPTQDFNRPVNDDRVVVAIVGAKPRTRYRDAAHAMMLSTDFRVYTTGGAPMGPGFGLGRLDLLIHPEGHPAWDAAHLPGLSEIGAVIVNLATGEQLYVNEILQRMASRRYRGTTGAKGVMPPHVIARDANLAWEAVDALSHLYR